MDPGRAGIDPALDVLTTGMFHAVSGTVYIDASGQSPAAESGRYRFPRSAKLLKHALFDQVYRRGQRHFSGLMTVFFLQRGIPVSDQPSIDQGTSGSLPGTATLVETAGARVGLTVGRVLGPSVVRNRIRRRMREAVRFNLNLVTGPVDIVINPKKAVLTAEFSTIVDEVRKAFLSVEKRRQLASSKPSARSTADRPMEDKR